MNLAIDSHVHLWTADQKKYPRAAGERDYPPAHFPPETLFRHSKPAGVGKIVLIQMSFYRFDNSYMLDCMRRYPGVFGGVGIVDENGPDPAGAMRELAQHGVQGFRIVPRGDTAAWLNAEGMRTMWAEGARRRLAMCALIGPDGLPALDQMCARYPDTPVVIDHFARIGAAGPVTDPDIRKLSALARHRHVAVKASAFYALGKKTAPYTDLKPLFRRIFEDFGPRRVMWGSDCPFQVEDGHSYATSIALIREQMPFLSADDREWVLGRTAESIFFRK